MVVRKLRSLQKIQTALDDGNDLDNFIICARILFSEQRRLRDDEYPLEVRVVLGPHENVARLFLVDKLSTPEISSDVAQFLNLSLAECHGILQRYHYEEERQIVLLKEK